MSFVSPWFYFILMAIYAMVAWGLSHLTGWGDQSQEKTSGQHYGALDGLRGILAISVFFYHALLTHYYIQSGFHAWYLPNSNFYNQLAKFPVTMFFFISGFLFWSKLMESRNGLPFKKFFLKRVQRLMPAYLGSFSLVLLCVAVGTNYHLQVPIGKLMKQLAFWLFCGVPYGFSRINDFKETFLINAGVFWSLQLEWVFYLVLPFLAWFAKGKRIFWLLLLCALIVPLPHLTKPVSVAAVTGLAELFAFYMLYCFSGGMLVAFLKPRIKNASFLKHPVCTVIAIGLLVAELFLVRPYYGFVESILLAPILLMVVFGNDFHGLLTSRPLAYLGAISYSVYVLHGTVIYIVTRSLYRRFDLTSASPIAYWAMMGATGVGVLLLSSVSYGLLERPFMRATSKKSLAMREPHRQVPVVTLSPPA